MNQPILLPFLLPFSTELVTPLNLGMVGGALFVLLLVVVFFVRRSHHRHRAPISHREPMDVLANRLRDTGPTSPEALQGGLRHMPLPDLLQFLAQGRRTGGVKINSGRREGEVRLVQGMVESARYRNMVDLDALFEMLSLESGDFVFTPSKAPEYPVNGREVVDILMLWLSRKDAIR